MPVLSPRQEAMLAYIWAYHQTQGLPPSQRDIQQALLYRSISVVSYQLARLAELGYVILRAHVARGIMLTELGQARGQEISRARAK